MDEVAIELRELRKRHGAVTAVDGITFTVATGEIFGLLGHNGAPARPRVSSRQHHVLVVDDDPAILSVVRDVLREHGYAVTTASNGEEALSAVSQAQPDAVLLDVHMPVLDGGAFAEAMRDRGLRIPLVVMTSGPSAETWAQRLGAGGYLPAPFAVDQLLRVTGRVAQERATPQ